MGDCAPEDSFCGFEWIFGGAAVGGTFGMALGTHLANDRRGSLIRDFAVGMLIWAGGIGLAGGSGWQESVTLAAFVGIPIAQLAALAALEQAASRRDGHEPPAAVLWVMPGPDRGLAVQATLSL